MNALHRFLALALLAASLPALAGGTAMVQSGSQSKSRMEIAWSGKKMRMGFPAQKDTYMVVRDDKTYSVTNQGGQPMVMDMSAMTKMAKSQAGAELAAKKAQSVGSIESTGKAETVAGVKGEVYRITWTDNAGNKHEDTAVLSHDPRAVGLTRAFQRFADTGGGQPDPIGAALAERDLGILRFGEEFEVVSLSDEDPPASKFELPAEPMDMQQMMQRFGGGGQ